MLSVWRERLDKFADEIVGGTIGEEELFGSITAADRSAHSNAPSLYSAFVTPEDVIVYCLRDVLALGVPPPERTSRNCS
jgi:hypothetical protein